MGITFEYQSGATPIDLNEAQGLIPALSTQAELNAFELLNINEARSWATRSRIVKANLLTPDAIKLIHLRMFDHTWKWAGKYRVTAKTIGIEAYRISTEVHNLMENVKVWMREQVYAPDELCARFHHRLVQIHAFPNGNGRHARFVVDLLAANQRWEPLTWGSSNLGLRSHARDQYISALQLADHHQIGALTQFIKS